MITARSERNSNWFSVVCLLLFASFGCNAFALQTTVGKDIKDSPGKDIKDTSGVAINFTDTPSLFPNYYTKSPILVKATFLDPVQDKNEIVKEQRLLREEIARYPSEFIKQNLKDIYVVKTLSYYDTAVGGFGWPEGKRLYLMNDVYSETDFRDTFHHELAHVLLRNHSAQFALNRWQRLNPPAFHYGIGGLESIRKGTAGSGNPDPAYWEQGFACLYGMVDADEDFACLCAEVFSGDPRFWQAVDRYEILNKKVKMVVDFYHSLNEELTEPYFRALAPYPSELPARPGHLNPGDVILFPNGGQLILPGNPPKTITIPPGGTLVYGGTGTIIFNPPTK